MVAPEDVSLARWSKAQPPPHTLALLEHKYNDGKREEKPQFNWYYVSAIRGESSKQNLGWARGKDIYISYSYVFVDENLSPVHTDKDMQNDRS